MGYHIKKLLMGLNWGLELMINLPELECNRCNHKWNPRTPKEPKVCPKCKSPYWNKERVRKDVHFQKGGSR